MKQILNNDVKVFRIIKMHEFFYILANPRTTQFLFCLIIEPTSEALQFYLPNGISPNPVIIKVKMKKDNNVR